MSSKAVKGKGKPAPKPAAKQPAAPRSLDFSGLDLAALEQEVVQAAGEPLHVPFSEVYEDPDNPRTEFPEDEIAELAADIEQRGVLQPIVTRPRDERGYMIRFGAKRRRAAERAAQRTGKMTVPIVVYAAAEHLDDYAQVAENRRRSDLSPMDLARFIRRKMQRDGHNAAEIARRIGVDKSAITHHLALLEHPEPILALYRTGRCVSAKNLWELGNLYRDHPGEVEAFLQAGGGQEEITRATIRHLAARLNGQGGAGAGQGASLEAAGGAESVGPSNTHAGPDAAGKGSKSAGEGATPDPNVTALVTRMQEHFGAKVRLDYKPSGKGSVTFSFFSLDELDGLLEKWNVPQQ